MSAICSPVSQSVKKTFRLVSYVNNIRIMNIDVDKDMIRTLRIGDLKTSNHDQKRLHAVNLKRVAELKYLWHIVNVCLIDIKDNSDIKRKRLLAFLEM